MKKLNWAAPWLAWLMTTPLHAADGDYFSPTDDRVRVSLGAMHVTSSTTLRADSNTGVTGTTLNGESGFGLDHSDFEPKIQAMLRVTARQRLSFDYFTLDRSGNTTIGAVPVSFRDVVLPAGAPVSTHLSLRTFGITYGYSFWHSETLELAATLGVHSTDVSTQASVQTSTLHIVQDEDQAGPVPTVGLDATWVISKRFYLDGRAQYLHVHIDHVDGSLGFYYLDALYRYRPNVALGLGYNEVRAHLASTQNSHGGEFAFNTRGPELFLRVDF